MASTLDIAANRSSGKYTAGELFRRLLWGGGKILFRFSPRPCFGWRRFVLRCFGARIGRQVHIYNSARIYFPWNLAVGDWSAIGEDAFIYNLGRVTRHPLRYLYTSMKIDFTGNFAFLCQPPGESVVECQHLHSTPQTEYASSGIGV